MRGSVLVWDNSSGEAFFQWCSDDRVVARVERYERRRFLTDFPPVLEQIVATTPVDADTVVYFGAGPGSFTALKTGAAMLGGLLYARGVTRVRLISSLDILSLRTTVPCGAPCVALIPYRGDEVFLSVAVESGTGKRCYPIHPRAVPFAELDAILDRFAGMGGVVIAGGDLPVAVERSLSARSGTLTRRYPSPELSVERLDGVPRLGTVEIGSEPLMLRYMVAPADLPAGDREEYYVASN
ncbi:MAG TPA: hypothetical protein PKH10_07290 [bacterium]|nr:hypothetical protein [bacterium]